jgi:hypothetical protein
VKERIKKTLTDNGFDDDRADKIVATIRAKCCGGAEPTEAMMRHVTADDMIAKGIAPAAARIVAAMSRGDKPKKLKEENRETLDTAVLLAAHIAGGPAWITDEVLVRSTPKGARLPIASVFLGDDGRIFEAETVQWIDWIRAGVPLGDGMPIGGKHRRPVLLGSEKPAVRHLRDPFGLGPDVPLTMPGLTSVCGASFDGISDAKGDDGIPYVERAVSFLALVMRDEQPSPIGQRNAVQVAHDGIEALRKAYPLAAKAWDAGERPRATIVVPGVADPFVSAPGGEPAGSVGWAPTDDEILNAVITAGLTRDVLLLGIDLRLVATLPTANSPAAQMRRDYFSLKGVTLLNGSKPLVKWLTNAANGAGYRAEADVFRRALAALG